MNNKTIVETSILFVDDEMIIRKSFTRELQIEHFAVTTVSSGSEAIKALESRQYELVITDLMMVGVDGVDGFEVLKAVQKLAPQTIVIILTGDFDRGIAMDALRLGADDFALKPCEIEELVFRIRRCQEKRSLMQRLASQNQQSVEEKNHRQLVESGLAQSENIYPLALDAAFNGAWDRNLLINELYLSEILQHNLGYEGGKISDEESFANLLHPEDREFVLALRDAHIHGKTPRYKAEYRMRNKSGGWQWMLSQGRATLRNDQGKALRIIGTLTDITRLKAEDPE